VWSVKRSTPAQVRPGQRRTQRATLRKPGVDVASGFTPDVGLRSSQMVDKSVPRRESVDHRNPLLVVSSGFTPRRWPGFIPVTACTLPAPRFSVRRAFEVQGPQSRNCRAPRWGTAPRSRQGPMLRISRSDAALFP